MKKVNYVSRVDEARCTGCGQCEDICPTYAIKVDLEAAEVDEERCLACFKCRDICPEDAVRPTLRLEPGFFGLNPDDVDQGLLTELCARANLHPRQIICLCTGTRVKEVAAAVLKGASSPEEVALMTGVRSGCGLYCMEPILRLLNAHGVELKQPEGHRWYNITPTLWDVPKDVEEKYPQYFFEEDRQVIRTT